jgi:hypothetical protein
MFVSSVLIGTSAGEYGLFPYKLIFKYITGELSKSRDTGLRHVFWNHRWDFVGSPSAFFRVEPSAPTASVVRI